MSKIIIDLPGIDPGVAKDTVTMALNEWRMHRSALNYVQDRYCAHTHEFRVAHQVRLERILNAFEGLEINAYMEKT